jgi:hypothetical protein
MVSVTNKKNAKLARRVPEILPPFSYLVQPLGLKLDGDAVHRLAHGDNEPAVDDKLRQLRTPLVAVPAVPDQEFG